MMRPGAEGEAEEKRSSDKMSVQKLRPFPPGVHQKASGSGSVLCLNRRKLSSFSEFRGSGENLDFDLRLLNCEPICHLK